VVDSVAGWRLVKTSKRPEPVRVEPGARLKWNAQVWPADAAGRSKVTSVVMSEVGGGMSVLKIFPDEVSKSIAPL